jgi:hypothetical protein
MITNKDLFDILWGKYEQRKHRKAEKLTGDDTGGPREDGESRDPTDDANTG